MLKRTLKDKFREWRYWHITRKTRKFIPWVARKLPNNIKYWVVIDGMVKVEPNRNPIDVKGNEILAYFSHETR